jgi:hypothetical protein
VISVKLQINNDKVKAKTVGKYSKTLKVSVLLGIVVAIVLGLNFYSSYSLKQTVEIVKLQSAVPQDGRIMQDNMVKDTMLKTEYEKQGVYTLSDGTKKRSIILWSDRTRIVNAYASYYVRQATPLYWDALSKETPKKYSYLYKMDGELLKIDMNAKEFGKMLVPGDKINVRASYTDNQYTLPSEKDFAMQQQTGIQAQTSVSKNVMLFNNVVVLDILNGAGDSIFDIYYKLLALPKQQQQTTVASKEFQDQVAPSQILLNVTPEEADRYMFLKNKGPQYMMTLLPRTSGNLITEALNELQIGFARTGN